MTTNDLITAKADELAELVRTKMNDEYYRTHIFYQEHIWRRIDEQADSVRNAIAAYTRLDPAPLEGMLGSLRHVFGGSFGNPLADPARGYIDDVGEYITDWYGAAAEAFRMNFLNPYPEIRANQIALVRELALVLEAYQAIVNESRAKIVEIADRAKAALNTLGVPAAVPLTVVAAALAVVAAVATAPAALVVAAGGLALVGGGFSIASTVASETPVPSEAVIQGGNAEEVVRSVFNAIGLLRSDALNAEAKLAAALEYDVEQIRVAQVSAEHRELNLFIPYRPNVIDAFTPGSEVDFRLSTSAD